VVVVLVGKPSSMATGRGRARKIDDVYDAIVDLLVREVVYLSTAPVCFWGRAEVFVSM